MSCALTSGFTIPCRDAVSGVKRLLITEWSNIESSTSSNGVITALTLTNGKQFWVYELAEGVCKAMNKQIVSVENGTNYNEQTIDFKLHKVQAASRNEILLLSQNDLAVIYEGRDGNYHLYGEESGLKLTESTEDAGQAIGDFNGYDIKLAGTQPLPPKQVTTGLIADLIIASVS